MRPISLYSLIDRRRRHQLATEQTYRRRLARLGVGCAAVLLLGIFSGILAAGLAYVNLVDGLPALAQIPQMFDSHQGALYQPTQIYDRSGQHLLLSLENAGVSRQYLAVDSNQPEHFSPQLLRVVLGVVDQRFWESPGFSLTNLTNPQAVTIPERVVDDLLLWEEPRSTRSALRMRILAAQLVAQHGHVQVLEWYLNSTYFGHYAFGADSAAQLYLQKSAADVSLAEAALLLAANEAPALNPLDAPAAALERQREILDRLLASGVISESEHQAAVAEELRLASAPAAQIQIAPAFTRMVLNSLEEQFGLQRLERGGLRVTTTLDYSLQRELSCLTRTQLARLSGQPEGVAQLPDDGNCASVRLLPTLPPGSPALSEETAASAVVFDPQSGQVLALLGDTTLAGETEFLSTHAPGSLLTPFTALAGFVRGMSPSTLTWDIPASLPEDLAAYANPDGEFHGPVRLRIALANDYLAAQAQILEQVGAANVWRLAGAFGLPSLEEEQSTALLYEGGQVSPLEVAQAYGVFASQGQRVGRRQGANGAVRPALIVYVEDQDGNVLLDAHEPETQSVVSPQLSYLVHHILSDATARWPSLGSPNLLEIGRPSGAKIGQVAGGRQVWTAGYTPQRVVVFWLGAPGTGEPAAGPDVAQSEPLPNVRMAAGLWHAFMQHSAQSMPAADWPQPAGISRVEVCDPSGMLPTQACPDVVSEIFLTGSEPTAPDSLFQVFQINRETGRLATVFTPPALIESQTFLVPPAQAREWAAASQLPVPPEDYDAIQPPVSSTNVQISSPGLFAYVRGEAPIQGTAAGDDMNFYQVLVGQGLNPATWTQVGLDGTTPVSEGDLALWDTTGQEGLYAVRLQVVRADQTVETATIQVTVDNTPPLARIPYPINGQVFEDAENRAVIFQAEATDAVGIQRLAWWVDGKSVGETLQPPYAFTWQATKGEHQLEVRAYDLAGNEGVSEQVRFMVP